jgi:hypothetical protein
MKKAFYKGVEFAKHGPVGAWHFDRWARNQYRMNTYKKPRGPITVNQISAEEICPRSLATISL